MFTKRRCIIIEQKNEILFLALLINDHLVKNEEQKIPLEN